MAALVGAQASPIPNQPDGTLRLDDIANAIRMEDPHHPRTRLVCLENTQNQCGGAALTPAYTQQVADFAHSQGLLLHIDGARIFNAAVAQNVDVKTLAAPADSVTFCLSKGLGAPVGSVLCGSHDFIYEAKRYRKMVGGGMRQVGVIAAAGHVALDSMIERLDDDHTHARQLAEGLRTIPGLAVEAQVPTNMIYFSLTPAAKLSEAALVAEMHARGIVMYGADFGRFRLVTHYWVSATDVEKVVGALREVLH
jgi:threonine aldolase